VFNELDNKDEADMLALASFFQTLTGACRVVGASGINTNK
jgi:hypothetical protein